MNMHLRDLESSLSHPDTNEPAKPPIKPNKTEAAIALVLLAAARKKAAMFVIIAAIQRNLTANAA